MKRRALLQALPAAGLLSAAPWPVRSESVDRRGLANLRDSYASRDRRFRGRRRRPGCPFLCRRTPTGSRRSKRHRRQRRVQQDRGGTGVSGSDGRRCVQARRGATRGRGHEPLPHPRSQGRVDAGGWHAGDPRRTRHLPETDRTDADRRHRARNRARHHEARPHGRRQGASRVRVGDREHGAQSRRPAAAASGTSRQCWRPRRSTASART